MAASLRRLRLSWASFSRRALVLELPLGATPVMSMLPSLGVKLTKPIPPPPSPPPRDALLLAALASRERRLRTLQGVPGMLVGRRPELLLADDTDAPELWRERGMADWSAGVGEDDGPRCLRIGEQDKCLAPEDLALGGR